MKQHEFQNGFDDEGLAGQHAEGAARELCDARGTIDRVDRELVRLLKARMEAVRAVGELKQADASLPLRDEGREREVLRVWVEEARSHGLSEYFTGRILREILNYSRRSQERAPLAHGARVVRVGYQGAPACYSDLALSKLFAARGHALERRGYASFALLVSALEEEELDYALVPVENSVTGSIGEVNQLLVTRDLAVVDEEIWRVEHCLVGLRGARIEALREVRSHPVALGQCQRLFASLPHVRAVEHFDTAGAARSVRENGDPLVAAIAPVEAAERHGLVVLREGVADSSHNQTRFLLVAKHSEPADTRWPGKTTFTFTLKDKSGALAACLRVLAERGINLTRLESRAEPETPWEYMFLADLEGYAEEANIAAALGELRRFTNHLRVLGSYPSRALEAKPIELPRAPVTRGAQAVLTQETSSAPHTAQAPESNPREPEPAATSATSSAISAAPTPKSPRSTSPLHALAADGARSVVRVGGVPIGTERFTLILGPCAIESRDQIHDAAAMVKARGAHLLRGGAFKPRSSPYAFQGLGFEGVELLVEAGARYELPVVTEVLRPEDVAKVALRADMIQVGARNMQNSALLKELGKIRRPVLLKRGMSATLDELLQAAEYILAGGNHQVVLCERGIRTFETSTRNTLDLSAVPVLKSRTHLPVVVDPSHAAGVRSLVVPLALAAAAVGADGLIVECHPRPCEALCDKDQALAPEDVDQLVAGLAPILAAQGRRL